MNCLLLISCSERKVLTPEPLPAIDRYDGPTYRTLRKMRREGDLPAGLEILIISAKYGLLPSDAPIEDYNRRMTPLRASQLRPIIQEELQSWMDRTQGGYDQVFINLGKDYMRTLQGFHWGLTTTFCASGGIGQRVSQMKTWLARFAQP